MENIGHATEAMLGIAEERDGEFIAGAAFENWNANCIWGHLRIDKSPGKQFWIALADYIYNVCGCKRFSATVESTNKEAIRLNLHIGFEIEATLKDAGKNGDVLIMTLWRDKCRFLNWAKK